MATNETKRHSGHIYVLTSPKCKYVKIGGTDHAPMKRIREINSSEPYEDLGPWSLYDFRQVTDWRSVERSLHYTYRSKLARKISGQRELFALTPVEVSDRLGRIDEKLIVRKPTVDRMFQDEAFATFLGELFRVTGILSWLDMQGAWTFCLFPATAGGRYYTLNVGSHEVAYASFNRGGPILHMIYMDRLVAELPRVTRWLNKRSGWVSRGAYASALDRSVSVHFEGDFHTAREFLSLKGVRRAIVAYWTEALLELKERGSLSVFARSHNWNAVREINRRVTAGEL